VADITQGYQQLAVDTAQSLTVPTGAAYALVVAEGQAVRWRDDGTPPGATVGMPLAVGTYRLFDTALARLQFIGQAAGAKVNVSYYKTTNALLPE
jgi:hypothetical protein